MSSSSAVGSSLPHPTPLEPKDTCAGASELTFVAVKDLSELSEQQRDSAIKTYQLAFKEPPYNEKFTKAKVREIYGALANKGDLVFGKLGDRVISLTGGFLIGENKEIYYIDELAVVPEKQGQGYGRQTMLELLKRVDEKYTHIIGKEVRTNEDNVRSISLYNKAGFVAQTGPEVVAQLREDGKIGLDIRVHFSKPALEDEMRLKSLKRAAVVSPSGNITAVVFDQLLKSDRKALDDSIMGTWKSQRPDQEIEQCCFVTVPKTPEAIGRVEMFGGEFCGNATRSVVWLLTEGKDYNGLIEVSGVSRPLAFEVKDGEVAVEMPLPQAGMALVELADEGTLVHLEGITHLVVTDPNPKQSPRELLSHLLKANKYDLNSHPAVGVSYFNPATGKADFCVWVKEVATIFDETACGSGTCSIGIVLASKDKRSIEQAIMQPSGQVIQTRTDYASSGVTSSWISGKVEVLHDGEYKLQ